MIPQSDWKAMQDRLTKLEGLLEKKVVDNKEPSNLFSSTPG